jgi:hypothetical protein
MVNVCAIRNIVVINLMRLYKHLAISMNQTIENLCNFGPRNGTKNV